MSIPNFLIEMLQEQYGEEICNKIIKGYNIDRKTTFRVNTIKSNQCEIEEKLNKEGILFEKVNFSNQAYILKNAVEKQIEQMDIYKEGKIYLQSLSSMIPAIVLNPLPEKDILDMAAAPGGKTTQMAALSENKAHITACEVNAVRAERLKYNIEKQGANCVYCMIKDARIIDDFFSFNQILLDAPCSGSGTLNANNKNIEKTFTEKLISKSVKSQKTLLRKAINILKPGGELVYSTCSILSCENEDIVNSVLKDGQVEIIPIEEHWTNDLPLLPSKIYGTICIKPTELYEGFFVAKLRKKL